MQIMICISNLDGIFARVSAGSEFIAAVRKFESRKDDPSVTRFTIKIIVIGFLFPLHTAFLVLIDSDVS